MGGSSCTSASSSPSSAAGIRNVARVRLAHVWFGSILGDDGKPFKTRSGETIKLAELLDEAEERACKIGRRKKSRSSGSRAPRDRAHHRNRRGEICGPVAEPAERLRVFLGPNAQPAGEHRAVSAIRYVRIRSIFRKAAGSEAAAAPVADPFPRVDLREPPEIALAKKLLQFGEILPQVLDDYRPNLLANYLYELAITFHSFYEACPVLKAEAEVRASRLVLCRDTAQVLKQGLHLLGIEVPERM